MIKKIFISVVTVLFFIACDDSGGDSNGKNSVSSNGLPTSMNIFPDINNLRDVNGKSSKITSIMMNAEGYDIDAKAFIERLEANGFYVLLEGTIDNGCSEILYIKDTPESAHAMCFLSRLCNIDDHNGQYAKMTIYMDECINGIDLNEFYTYFLPILEYSSDIWLNYDDLTWASLNSYISMLKAIGFQKDADGNYVYGNYWFKYGASSDSYAIFFATHQPEPRQ